MRGKHTLFLYATAAVLILSGCSVNTDSSAIPVTVTPQPVNESQNSYPEQALQPRYGEPVIIPDSTSPLTSMSTAYKGDGTVVYASGVQRLDSAQEALLMDYMNTYYTSLALLERQDSSRLFALGAEDQLANDRAVLDTLIGIRSMQRSKLTLSAYSFKLTIQTVSAEDNGDISVRVSEDNIQNFTAYPGVDSAGFAVGHSFLLTDTGNGWRIKEHRQMGSLNRLVMGLGRWQPGVSTSRPTGSINFSGNVEKLLAEARKAVTKRATGGGSETDIRFDNAYNRRAAVDYARKWADSRNPAWPSYDRMGGNCQNFTSQAIFAGGVPMDYTAPGQWKWFGDTPNSSLQASGRSPAWSGVTEFLSYAESNSGSGMVALANAPYYSGEEGDVIHMGVGGDWRHTVIITKALKDESGRTIDYLVASNTSNFRDFPASAYYYADQMLIKIYGWNN